ncbi:MAG: TonB-dependent receptor [Dokdonella sp.]|uniref:TonB-dependent receptor n=1 Tax=Dokdonella sp. TaxID=2291710 RepID=UPI003F7E9595
MVRRTCGRARLRGGCTRPPLRPVALAILIVLAPSAGASTEAAPDPLSTTPLPGIVVHADGNDAIESPAFPASTATVDAAQIDESINAIDVEDAIKYLPSLFVRKRNYGDTQPVLATRTWGVGSSARTLVYVDDILISALVANNNTLGAPRWGVVAPDQVERVTMLYGPFSAAYAGNSIGGVLRIATRTPERTRFSFEQSGALQSFDHYRTSGDYPTSQSSATAGGRAGAATWFIGANQQNSFSQPLSYITGAAPPADTSGAIDATNKLGQPADVFGAGGLLHTRMHGLNGKIGWDFTPWLHATWLAGWWDNDADSRVETYLRDAAGRATFGRVAGFASNHYIVDQSHLMQALSLRSDTHGRWDGEAVLTHYEYLHDRQLSPAGVGDGTTFTPNGRYADLGGTNWSTLDLKGIWRSAAHEIAFGAHADEYTLDNATRNTTLWQDAGSATSLFTAGAGKTRTSALWLQDAWSIAPAWFATLGVRAERWRARDGFNFSGGTAVVQPDRSTTAWSPKATLSWTPSADWRVTGSLGKAVRFPTVSELYQIVSTGSTFVSPNPGLRPERALSGELALERSGELGTWRVSLFEETTRDALISQTSTIEGVASPATFVDNVGKVRNRGIEFVAQRRDAGLRRLDLAASITFVDSTILENDGFVGAGGSTSVGKHAPNVPRWRATVVATLRASDAWTFTLAGRYSGKQYSTLDNIDTTPHVYGAFDRFAVFDARVRWKAGEHVSAALGIDNLADRDYVLFHPFPRRTIVASVDVRY